MRARVRMPAPTRRGTPRRRASRRRRTPPSRRRCRSPTRRTSRTRSAGSSRATRTSWSTSAAGGRDLGRARTTRSSTGDAPASVNPSLWRQAKLNGVHGLFQVTEGIYQVRGYDVSNMTLIRGQTRLDRRRPAHRARDGGGGARVRAAPSRRRADRRGDLHAQPRRPLRRHRGRAAGRGRRSAACAIVAPRGFVEEATSENVLAGVAMGRRASFMYGMPLARSPRGHVDTGLGKAPARGTIGLRRAHRPRRPHAAGARARRRALRLPVRAATRRRRRSSPSTCPSAKAWCGAEIVSHTLHNLYTLRGAKVRDALRWSGYIDEAIERFGDAEVVFASHHWPVWGNARVLEYLKQQRDTYRYIHDQTLRLANAGLDAAGDRRGSSSCRARCARRSRTAATTAPSATTRRRSTSSTSAGTTAIRRTSIRCRPPKRRRATSRRWAARPRCCARRARAFERGEYRWAATLLDHLVFAEPDERRGARAARARLRPARLPGGVGPVARRLPDRRAASCATACRAAGLDLASAARPAAPPAARAASSRRWRRAWTAAKADGKRADAQLRVHRPRRDARADARERRAAPPAARRRSRTPPPRCGSRATSWCGSRPARPGLREMIFSDDLAVEGSRLELLSFFSLLDRPDGRFPIVTP